MADYKLSGDVGTMPLANHGGAPCAARRSARENADATKTGTPRLAGSSVARRRAGRRVCRSATSPAMQLDGNDTVPKKTATDGG